MKLVQMLSKSTLNALQVKDIATQLNLPQPIVQILADRGFSSLQEIRQFLYLENMQLYDPFELKNMHAVVHRLKQAKVKGQVVVIYGDYDCDGVCSSALLYNCFVKFGIVAKVHLPSRYKYGYGLKMKSIFELIQMYNPSLIVTCDCGISGVNEVTQIKALGVDVIVTDHHEPGEILPDCPIVNPRQKDCKYPDKNLCGTAIALKIAQALGFDEKLYLDLACIATVGDMVSLIGENRWIVLKGLKILNSKSGNKGLKKLLQVLQLKNINSQDIAFKIVPLINAAGRLDDATIAHTLFTCDDDLQIENIVSKLMEDNQRRKEICTFQYSEAVKMLSNIDLQRRFILLVSDTWEKGLTGILAARLANEFGRPCFVLALDKDRIYKATARSIVGVDMFALLSEAKQTLIEYGGHNQAAGFSILSDNIKKFEQIIDEKLNSLDENMFAKRQYFDLYIEQRQINVDLVKALNLLEPFGMANPRPIFKIVQKKLQVQLLKEKHIKLTDQSGFEVMSFNDCNTIKYSGDNEKELAIQLFLNEFNNRISVTSILVHFNTQQMFIPKNWAQSSLVLSNCFFGHSVNRIQTVNITFEQLQHKEINQYGTLIICNNILNYQKMKDKNFCNEVEHCFMFCGLNNNSKIIVTPIFEQIELGFYQEIVFDSEPLSKSLLGYVQEKTNAKIFICDMPKPYLNLDLSRQAFIECYKVIEDIKNENITKNMRQTNLFELALLAKKYGIEQCQFIMCFRIFQELQIVKTHSNSQFLHFEINKIKAELDNSSIYRNIYTIIAKTDS
ncbi:MAG: single-stranded-DNA-specific exonuclease RecJ [Clostridiales bacterium]|nr:single-stranded-DNA-specific exonuclease RecJ [Clostridiales bacterium]